MKKKGVRRISCVIAALLLQSLFTLNLYADDTAPFDVNAKSAVLMEAETGEILYSKSGDEALPPASVTKIMTLLLVMEAIDSGAYALDDPVTTSEYAASMGGSQVFLEAGETMSVEEMVKCVVIASANDAATALAEKTSGSVDEFVRQMNIRASELSMTATHFENPTGLDDATTDHVTSATDIAIMSRELLKHDTILKYSGIWMDTIRDGAFGLTNTNRLIRFYSGATGLKTGSTSKAGFCISATAERNGMHLIAVIMGSPTRDERNNAAKTLLDWGFGKYSIYKADGGEIGSVSITGGVTDSVRVRAGDFKILLPCGKGKDVTETIDMPESLPAPVTVGQNVGYVRYFLDDEEIGCAEITAMDDGQRIGYFGVLYRLFCRFILQ